MKNKAKKIFQKIWWTAPLLFITILLLAYNSCNNITKCNKIHNELNLIENKILECCGDLKKDTIIAGSKVKKPTNQCRAHFSGLLMSDEFRKGWKTEIFKLDNSSEYVGEGEYAKAILAFPKSHAATFDGIAIDKGTRVIIYSMENFQGDILMDETGPVIITNKIRIEDPTIIDSVQVNNRKIFKGYLEELFPANVRKISSSNMFEWSQGSLKVICIKQQQKEKNKFKNFINKTFKK